MHFGKESYPQKNYNKLKPKKIGLCPVFSRINDNVYLLKLTETIDINHVFNVTDIHPFQVGIKDIEIT